MSIESVLNHAILRKTNYSKLYKIETYSAESAEIIRQYIINHSHKCAVLGWAIITDFVFSDESCLELLPLISNINDIISDIDSQHFIHC